MSAPRGPRTRPKTWLQNEQGHLLARALTVEGVTEDLQKLIWTDVTTNYYRRLGDRLDHAAGALQAAVRRLLALIMKSGSRRQVDFMMLAARSSVWKRRFDNLHNTRMKYRETVSKKWHWALVGQYEGAAYPG